jgi:signal transduction histidine kinase
VKREPGAPRTGTGLGLTFVKMAAQEMGGDVALESQVDVGSKFTITLPAAQSD